MDNGSEIESEKGYNKRRPRNKSRKVLRNASSRTSEHETKDTREKNGNNKIVVNKNESNEFNTEKKTDEPVLPSSNRLKCTLCLLGCLTICGLRSRIVRKLAFAPPEVKGYSIENNNFVCKHLRGTEFEEIIKRYNLGVDYIQITSYFSKIASVLIYKKPLNLDKQIILFSHGNSTDVGHMSMFFLNLVLYNDVNLIAYDYSGYGYSNKKPSERNIYKNIKTVYKYLTEEMKVNPRKIIAYGHSIGSACNCYLLSQKKVELGGCILHSPLASGLRLLVHLDDSKGPWFDVFKNVERLKKVKPIPIFVMHGKKDRQVPYAHAIHLMNTLKENYEKKSKDNLSLINFWGIENADHNDIEEKNTIVFYKKIKEFLTLCENYNNNLP